MIIIHEPQDLYVYLRAATYLVEDSYKIYVVSRFLEIAIKDLIRIYISLI